jgi:hypothetical protein
MVEAKNGPEPKEQLFLKDMNRKQYEGELLCIIPNKLRGLYDLSIQICLYGMELEARLAEQKEGSEEYINQEENLFLIEEKAALASDTLFVELLQQCPEMDVGENYAILYTSEWKVIRIPSEEIDEETNINDPHGETIRYLN